MYVLADMIERKDIERWAFEYIENTQAPGSFDREISKSCDDATDRYSYIVYKV